MYNLRKGHEIIDFGCEEFFEISQQKDLSLTYQDAINFMKFIEDDNVSSLKEIIKKYGENFIKLVSYKGQYDPIFYSIYHEKILSLSLLIEVYGKDKFLQQQDYKNFLSPIFFSILHNKTLALDLMIKSFGYEEVLDSQNPQDKLTPIFFALMNSSKDSFKLLLNYYDPKNLITLSDLDDENLIIFALKKFNDYADSNPKKKVSRENLELLLKTIFGDDIDIEKKLSKLQEFYRSYCYLRLGYTFKDFPVEEYALLKIRNELEELSIFRESKIFKEISKKIIEHIDTVKPLKIEGKNPENLYIFLSNLDDHSSYFIFHANPENNKILALSYIDGNDLMPETTLSVEKKLIYGVNKFILDQPVDFYGNEQFKAIIDEFITESSYRQVAKNFLVNLASGDVKFFNQKLIECKQESSIRIVEQDRGNCVLKSNKILQRYLASKLYPKMSFETQTPEGKEDGKELFKTYKNELRDIAIAKLEEFSKTLDPKDEFESFLLREKEILLLNVNKKIRDKVAKKNFQMFVDVASRQTPVAQSLKRSHALISSQGQELSSPSPTSSSNAGDQLVNKKITKIPS